MTKKTKFIIKVICVDLLNYAFWLGMLAIFEQLTIGSAIILAIFSLVGSFIGYGLVRNKY